MCWVCNLAFSLFSCYVTPDVLPPKKICFSTWWSTQFAKNILVPNLSQQNIGSMPTFNACLLKARPRKCSMHGIWDLMGLESEGLSSSLCSAFSLSTELPEAHRAWGRAGAKCPAACPLSKEESNLTRSSALECMLGQGESTCALITSKISSGQDVKEGSIPFVLFSV